MKISLEAITPQITHFRAMGMAFFRFPDAPSFLDFFLLFTEMCGLVKFSCKLQVLNGKLSGKKCLFPGTRRLSVSAIE